MSGIADKIRDALRLTRAGDLRGATDVIRGALQKNSTSSRKRVEPTADIGFASFDNAAAAAKPSPSARASALRERFRPPPIKAAAPAPVAAPKRDAVPEMDFRAGAFANAAGSRTYKLLKPSRPAKPTSLIVMLHGCTQDAEDFAAGTRMNQLAEREGCYVLYPEQAGTVNPQRCWSWFQAADQRRDQGEPSIIAGMTRQIIRDHGLVPWRVYVAGLSAGGAMAVVLGETYPDLYAAVGVHSGLRYGVAHDVPSALAAMKSGEPAMQRGGPTPRATGTGVPPPTIVIHGTRDTTVVPANGDALVAELRSRRPGLKLVNERGQAPGGNSYQCTRFHTDDGKIAIEQWKVDGMGHAWSGGDPSGSFTDARGPDASELLLKFFLAQHR